MKISPADILRLQRRRILADVKNCERRADDCERQAADLRKIVKENMVLHCRLGAAVQLLEGDNAKLDLPPEDERWG